VTTQSLSRHQSLPGSTLLPGLAMCLTVTGAAFVLQRIEEAMFGRAWLEALVLAILVGTAVRTAWTPDRRWFPGISFSAKFLLELAVVLLGASVSAATILAAGPGLLLGIAGVVCVAIASSYLIGRMLRLPKRMALLVACGNAICGNSAIAAVAPVIGADGDDVAASIGFTAVLGVVVVLGLPLLAFGLHLSGHQFGALAGLTVYAVPQVIAAATPGGATAVQMGTLVKLVRVLMLGPVCLILSLVAPTLREEVDEPPPRHHRRTPCGRAAGAAPPGTLVHPRLPRPGRPAVLRPDPARGPGSGERGRDAAHRRLDGSAWPGGRRPHGGPCRRPCDRGGRPLAPHARGDQPRPDPPAGTGLNRPALALPFSQRRPS
jgi:uncharacterized integral membrane protein (TIGR00698 family)